MLVAFGLGNPGDRYHGTRHNIGKEVIGSLVDRMKLSLSAGSGSFFHALDSGRDLCLVVPTIYMNASGRSAREVLDWLGLGPENLLVVCDDFNLPLGTLRIRKKGSDGGHNGLASVIYQLATEEFPRLRIGVGPLPPGADSVDFVLGGFSAEERAGVEEAKQQAGEAVLEVAESGLDSAMNRFNRRTGS